MAEFLTVIPDGARRARPDAPRRAAFERSHLEVRMFNIGEGESILVVPPRSRNAWIVDCGCHRSRELGEALAGYLRAERLRLKGIVLSHPHTDHGRAIKTVLQRAPLARDIRYFHSDDAYFPTTTPGSGKKWLRDLNVKLRQVGARTSTVRRRLRNVNLGNGVRARLFSGQLASKGYTSIFLNLRFRDAHLLFTGDVKCSYELELLERRNHADFRADVLKLTHHGNSDGTSKRLLCAVQPGIAIASTGRDSGHSLEFDVLDRLQVGGQRRIFETLIEGDIILKTDGRRFDGGVLYQVDFQSRGRFAQAVGAEVRGIRRVDSDREPRTSPRRLRNCKRDC